MRNLWIAGLAGMVAACVVPLPPKVPVAVSGSKADGIVKLAYDVKLNEQYAVDQNAGNANALRRCQAWGYTRVEPFAGERKECTTQGAGIWVNGAPVGACAVTTHTRDYQCLD
ncbi:MAG: YecR family lipoprotein [Pseudomonadota bacterium]